MGVILGLLTYSVVALTLGRQTLVRRTATGSSPRLAGRGGHLRSVGVPGAGVAGGVLRPPAAAEAPPLAGLAAGCRSLLHHGLDRVPAIGWIGTAATVGLA